MQLKMPVTSDMQKIFTSVSLDEIIKKMILQLVPVLKYFSFFIKINKIFLLV
jgi:hypothetical protein